MKISVEPQYIRVQNALRLLIAKGIYQAGDTLPSENDLSAEFGITRMTVRNALSALEKDGLISKKKGIGSIVHSKRKSIELLSIKGFTEVMKTESFKTKTKVIKKPTLDNWGNDFFFELSENEIDAGCIKMERLRKIDKEPVMFEATFIPNINLPKFCAKPFVNGSLFDTLHISYGIEIISVVQNFRAIKAQGNQVKLLGISRGNPLLHIIRKLSTNRENFNIYSSVYFNSENHSIEL